MAVNTAVWVGVVMGSKSDYEYLLPACEILSDFQIPHETRVLSAHRTLDLTVEYADKAIERGMEVIIAGAGGAAHLPGVLAAKTLLPVLGVPIPSTDLRGFDALLSIAQMPKGVPVATMAIGKAGAANAALFAAAIIASRHPEVRGRLAAFRAARVEEALKQRLP
jgi:5-(carboxyamino)imidazole ribonucleotide mutase